MHAERVRRYGSTDERPRKSRPKCSVEGCVRPHNAKGLCTTHAERLKRTGSIAAPKRPTPRERFSNYGGADGDSAQCWPWRGPRTASGYGVLVVGQQHIYAHRYAYELAYGEIPTDRPIIMHSCDTPPCVNPAHLSAGTLRANSDDKVGKGRQYRGESVWASKLTSNDVRSIRALYGKLTAQELATKYGISAQHAVSVARRSSWAWLD